MRISFLILGLKFFGIYGFFVVIKLCSAVWTLCFSKFVLVPLYFDVVIAAHAKMVAALKLVSLTKHVETKHAVHGELFLGFF
jgi:hypothetical protein